MIDTAPESFTLQNPAPKPAPWKPQPAERKRQTVLFAGMDCLPGQNDLFATDGRDDKETR